MPEWVKAWWGGLSMQMRWFVMVIVVIVLGFLLSTYAFMGTDWSGPFSLIMGR